MIKPSRCFASLAIAFTFGGSALFATPIAFTVDTSQSYLDLESVSTRPTIAQGTEAWTASYSGTIFADLTATSIQILPSTELAAGNSGSWKPGDVYPTTGRAEDFPEYTQAEADANYGLITDLSSPSNPNAPTASYSAIRGIQLSLEDTAPKPLTGGVFSEAGMTPTFLAGIHYYDYGSAAFGGPISDLSGAGILVSLTEDTAGDGSLIQAGKLLKLTLPVRFHAQYFFPDYYLTGTIVATAVVPEPMTAVLLLPVASLLLVAPRRRLKAFPIL